MFSLPFPKKITFLGFCYFKIVHMGMGIAMGMVVSGKWEWEKVLLREWVGIGMISWEWEGTGRVKVILAHLYW